MSEIFKFFIEGVCTSLLGISGIIGNVVSIAVLSSSELDMMPSFRHLLKMLAAFDATFLIFTLTLFGISPWSTHYDQFIKPWLIPYFLPIVQVKRILQASCQSFFVNAKLFFGPLLKKRLFGNDEKSLPKVIK